MNKSSAGSKTSMEVFYNETIVPALQKEFQYKNVHQIPRLEKIVINRGLGSKSAPAFNAPLATSTPSTTKRVDAFFKELTTIAGQKCVVTKSKKAIASFQLRENVPIGLSVNLRSRRMYAFIDRLIHLALPRVRDFQGLPLSSFDGKGNYSFGVQEQFLFPEISIEDVSYGQGMDICFVTTAQTDAEALFLLQNFGFPFRKD
jgi:large subunit ribosomal protein L5